MSYTENQFNQAMAELEGIPHRVVNGRVFVDGPFDSSDEYMAFSDLNILMPLAWKHGIEIRTADDMGIFAIQSHISMDEAVSSDVYSFGGEVSTIRDCLWQLSQERK